MDTPSKKQLIAANKSVEEIRDYIGADSLAYLSMEGMKESCGDGEKTTYCTACYTGSYPTAWVDVLLEDVRPVTVMSRLAGASEAAKRRAAEGTANNRELAEEFPLSPGLAEPGH